MSTKVKVRVTKKFLLAAFASSAFASQPDMALFQRADFDHDGKVNCVEAYGSVDLQARFRDIDVNSDGILTEQEMHDWIARPDKLGLMRDSAHINCAESRRAVDESRTEQRRVEEGSEQRDALKK